MSYTKENLQYATKIIADRKQNAEEIQRIRHGKAVAKVPEIAKYEAQLAQTGLAVLKAISMDTGAEEYIEELAEMNGRIQQYIKKSLVDGGFPSDYLDTPYTCRECEDTGFKNGRICSCRRMLLNELALKDLEKVSPAANCRFDNFSLDYYPDTPDPVYGISPREKMAEVLEYCKCYAEDFDAESNSLYLRGATGLGKTHLSLAIANVAVRNGWNVLYGSAQNFFSAMEKDKFSNYNSAETEAKMLEADLLIIDDLGSEFITRFTVNELYNIINTRGNLGKPVIISTNLSDKELEENYSQRITSRIIGNYTSLYFMGRDIRQIKAAE